MGEVKWHAGSGSDGSHCDKNQRESNMHRFEGHHFVSRFASHFVVGENSGFMLEILCK